jgi:diaminohydroxyphosphoribosylaminopyrimidine deaminase/5-amino-6-(5-phosphoribosylamino)uracil reductase
MRSDLDWKRLLAIAHGGANAESLAADAEHEPFFDLYLPIALGTLDRPVTVGHLGQSLDGFIATLAGESRWVTGNENLLHVHRLRALCDVVVVGAGTVAADDPQLTTRLVPGPNPVRVILDPGRRLGNEHRIFNDHTAATLYVCARSLVRPNECSIGLAPIVGVDGNADDGIDFGEVIQLLHGRGWKRIFVEGGGVTVSNFFAAKLLDRLHVAIAPLLIGEGRPAIRLTPSAALGDCHRPQYRVFRTGTDILFDCDLGRRADREEAEPQPGIMRVI